MVISDSYNENLEALLDLQDDGEECDDDDRSSEEDNDVAVENNRSYSGLKDVRSYREITCDIMNWEKEVKNMMENVKQIHVALSDGCRIEEIFKFHDEEFLNKKVNGEEDLAASLTEVDKMDAILKIKATEEKKAKLSRIQAEEESRDILSKLPRGEMSNGMKINLDEFMRLLDEVEKAEEGFSIETRKEKEEEEEKEKEEDEKTSSDHHHHQTKKKKKNLKFVERNIQLAKCGRGTLSLTDREKTRIEDLLIDVGEKKEEFNEKKTEFYGIDDETKSILREIDEQLEILTKEKLVIGVESNLSQKESEEAVVEDGDEKIRQKKNKPIRLEEIDKLLASINSISTEEISPLSEEQMGNLLQQFKQKEKTEDGKLEEKKIAELVSNAKTLMPKFKYKFHVS